MPCFKLAVSLLCVGAATTGGLRAQVRGYLPGRAPTLTGSGIGFRYGVILPGHMTLYRSAVSEARHSGWAMFRAAASLTGELEFDFRTSERELRQGLGVSLVASTTLFDRTQFHGFGSGLNGGEAYQVKQHRLRLAPTMTVSAGSPNISVSFGPVLKYTSTRFDRDDMAVPGQVAPSASGGILSAGSGSLELAEPYGFGRFGQVGGWADLAMGGPAPGTVPAGVSLSVGASAYPPLLDVATPFAEVHGEMAGYVTVSVPTSPTLALRVGGKKLWGAVPINEAAFLGGSGSLRAFGRRSLAGDAAVYGSAELRLTAGEVTMFKRHLRYGFLGLTDIGRVFYDGISSDGWLSDLGGGLWFAPLGGKEVLSAGVARGPLGSRLFFRVELRPGEPQHP
jgi:hypothetical protein